MKKNLNRFNLVFNIYVSVIINVALCIVLPLTAMGVLSLPIFFKGFIIAFPVSTLIVLFLPISRLGDSVAEKFGLRVHSFPHTRIISRIISLDT